MIISLFQVSQHMKELKCLLRQEMYNRYPIMSY